VLLSSDEAHFKYVTARSVSMAEESGVSLISGKFQGAPAIFVQHTRGYGFGLGVACRWVIKELGGIKELEQEVGKKMRSFF
jgi:hypothetical protein